MASQIEIINYAAGKVGAETTLTDLLENNKLARTAAVVWPLALDATLAASPWNFAMARAALPALSSAPAFGYALQYQRPTDLLRLVEINDVHVWNLFPGSDAPYSYEGDKILTDMGAPLRLRYVRRVTDPTLFSPKFVEAFAFKLAMEFALPVTESEATRQAMETAFLAEVNEAKGIDGRENPPEIPDEDDWIMARCMDVL